jgi:hypothetical protein
MLAQNFKSATDLKLTKQEYNALVTTLGMMERGEIKHVITNEDEEKGDYGTEFSALFNLASWASRFECGTVACIGGTAELIGKLKPYAISDKCGWYDMSDLDELCYPKGDIEYEKVTVEQAAKALRSYLTTGKANWAEALA